MDFPHTFVVVSDGLHCCVEVVLHLGSNVPVREHDNNCHQDVLQEERSGKAKPEAGQTHFQIEAQNDCQRHTENVIAAKRGNAGLKLFSHGTHNPRINPMNGIKDQVDRNYFQHAIDVVDGQLVFCEQTCHRILIQFNHRHDQCHENDRVDDVSDGILLGESRVFSTDLTAD